MNRSIKEMNIARSIAAARKKAGYIKSALANKAKISVSAISMLENGQRSPSCSALVKISQALDITLAELIGEATVTLPLPTVPAFEPPVLPLLLWCPGCGERHIDEGEYATKKHHTHACQSCGLVWRPSVEYTIGVKFLPGFRNNEKLGS